MVFFSHIKSTVLGALLVGLITGFLAPAVLAADLTVKERSICPTLKVCVDIIGRHTASEFDYNVLESQFRRFGPKGRDALFDILESDAGNPDVARMISVIGPLSAGERSRLQKTWTPEKAGHYLPLLLDGHPLSRDMLLLTLDSDQVIIRQAARRALSKLPKTASTQPISNRLREPLLSALARDPIPEAAPYLARLSAEGHQGKFAKLLSSGDSSIVAGAYAALYRNNPSQAFSTLLSEMGRVSTPEQSKAIGEMLVRRHALRSDGFYLKFAGDISGDKTRPIPARASGLHAVLISGKTKLPEFTAERAQALAYLVRSQPQQTETQYLPFLKAVKAESEMAYIWDIAQREKWINRDKISLFYQGSSTEDKVIGDLLRSDDVRSFQAGLKSAKPIHNGLIRAQLDHPIKAIGDLARQKLKLSGQGRPNVPCLISQFDVTDVVNQMPFYDLPWMSASNGARVSLERKFLTTAHPSKLGWLAGYRLDAAPSKSTPTGGALVQFDNESGGFKPVGNFSGPIAILPNRTLKLGQTTERFWVIDDWGGPSSDVSAFALDMSGPQPKITHMAALPNSAHSFSVAPNGDLLMRFKGEKQVPLRLNQRGDISLACAAPRRAPNPPAPN